MSAPAAMATDGAGAGPQRLNRLLADRGVASRRSADRLIAAGRVLVDGRRPPRSGCLVDQGAVVLVDGRPIAERSPGPMYLVLNKPPGVVSTARDPLGRATVVDTVAQGPRVFPVGRLDLASRGLVLLTNDGELALRLTHPRYRVPKHYRVAVGGWPQVAQLSHLRAGAMLEDGPATPLLVAEEGAWPGGRRLRIVIADGRNQEVRRLCAAVGLRVHDLQRVGIGPLRLGGLPEGTVRELGPRELERLRVAGGLPARP